MTTITEHNAQRLAQDQLETEYDGFKLVLRRAPVSLWLRNGRVPQSLASLMLASFKDKDTDFQPEATAEEVAAFEKFKQDVITYTCVEPKIIFEGSGVGISAEELEASAPFILEYIFHYGTRQIDGKPEASDEGEASVKTLETFRNDAPGAEGIAGDSVHGADVQQKAVGNAGD